VTENPGFNSEVVLTDSPPHLIVSELIDMLSGRPLVISSKACYVIHGLIQNNKALCQQFVNAGALIRLVYVLCTRTVEVKLRACVAHALIAFCNTKLECQNLIAQLGGLEPLLELFSLLHADQVKKIACLAVAAMVRNNSKLQNSVRKVNGAVEGIIQCLLSKDSQLKTYACECLLELAKDNEKCQEAVCNAGAPQLLVNILMHNRVASDAEQLIFSALSTVWILIQKKKARKMFGDYDLAASVEPVAESAPTASETYAHIQMLARQVLTIAKKK